MTYAVACADSDLRASLIANSLYLSLSAGKSAVLVTEQVPALILQQARVAGIDLKEFVQRRQLQFLRHPPQPASDLATRGARRFVDELDQAELTPGSLVIFDGADPLYRLADPRQALTAAQRYAAWAQLRGHTLLSVFAPAEKSPREFVTLKTIAGELAGFALIVATKEHAILDLRHWNGADGANQRQCLRLGRDSRGRLLVVSPESKPLPMTSTAASVRAASVAATESVIAMLNAFETEHRLASADWSWVDSIAVAVARVRPQVPTTVVLQFSDAAQYDSLCSAVRDLRKLGSPHLRVVIRERGARLRMPMALVLLRLGASLIIPTGTTDASARLHIEALRGTRFNRVCDSDIVQVSEDIRAVLNADLQDAGQFRLSVERLLAHTESYDIDHTLVRLFAKPGQQENALAIVEQLGRDFLVARNGVEIWLFLFACGRGDVRTVLDRIFAESLNALFSDWSAVYEPQRMLAALEGIRLPPATGGQSDGREVITDSAHQLGAFTAV